MPHTPVIVVESPFNGFECYAGLDVRVLIDDDRVIINNKLEPVHLIINGKGD
jgi:hypothetical protein